MCRTVSDRFDTKWDCMSAYYVFVEADYWEDFAGDEICVDQLEEDRALVVVGEVLLDLLSEWLLPCSHRYDDRMATDGCTPSDRTDGHDRCASCCYSCTRSVDDTRCDVVVVVES